MKISILNDSYFEEAHLARLRACGSVSIHVETLTAEDAIVRLRNADIALLDGFKVPISRTIIESARKLRLLVLNSTAFHMVDISAANDRGVKVANIPGYSTEAVAEHAIALMFAVVRALPRANAAIRTKPVKITGNIKDDRIPLGYDLQGKTLGLLGLGAIGRRVAELGLGLGMKVVAHNRSPRSVSQVKTIPFDELLRVSDVISTNLSVNEETIGIISDRELTLMKPNAVLINTADAALIDTNALALALADRKIFGAGIDGFANWDSANPLLNFDNVVLCPNTAWWTRETCANQAESVVKTVEAFVKGRPINVVN